MNTTEPPTSQPESSAPPPGQPVGPRRLTRSSGAKIGGVAAGIAQYFGIDPTIVRLLFAASIFLGGFGLICYLIAWVVLPADDGSNVASAPHTATAVARGEGVTAARIAYDDLTSLIRRRPDIGVVIYRNLAADVSAKLKRTCPP